jgi:outer membrane protein assembly factor BamB
MLRAVLFFLLAVSNASAGDWPQFRGPTRDGHYTGPKLPTVWGPDTNVAWKVPVPGKGWSSPIVSKGKVFLTTGVSQSGGLSLRAICVDATSGKVEWDVEALRIDKAPYAHTKNSQASPTPATDGERLYVHFGHMGTAALDLTGKVLWTRTGLYDKPVHGNGGSPILVDGLLVFSCDGADKQFVIALQTKDGKTAWETPRETSAAKQFSFGTPQIAEVSGKKQVISEGSDVLAGYDLQTGRELWRFTFRGYSVIPQPAVGHGRVFLSTGFDNPAMKAVRLGGSGDVTSSHAAWTQARGAPHTPSPLLVGDELYIVSDRGILSCLDAATGELVWDDRLKGGYSASPLYADGKIYLTSEEGKGTLVAAGRKKDVLGEFDLKEKTFASFAAADGALYVRTETQLYKFAGR